MLSAPGSVLAGEDEAGSVLKKVDSNLTKVQDQTYDADISVIRDNKITKTMKFTVKLKGLTMKLVKFTAPGDLRGMSVLTTAEGYMYVYLPSYQKVRRIASHVRNQGFMGTDFSPDDFGSAALSVGWTPTIESQDNTKWVLILKPTPGNETSYQKLRVTVLKKYGGVSRIEYFASQDKLVKTQDREDWKAFGPLTVPTRFTATDLRTGSKTVMRLFDCKVNTGLEDSAFTKRALLRSN
jgi:outer membrane lipoprotein-sorting protein